MDGDTLIALAIPVFFVMIAGEYLLAHRMGRPELYRFNDAISDLSCGIGQQVTGLFNKAAAIALYAFLWHNLALFDLSGTPALHWFLGIVLYDLAYYAWHRFTHEVNLGWATHVVHHQSQEYNLAVALRQSVTGWITGIPFYLPLAILGVSPLVFAVSGAISLLYQFWIHTEIIDRLGPFEWVMNTPSHHRVHHAINPQYLDKNYAAIFIVWDRLFGTFENESEQPVYGTVKPLDSFDPVWAQVWYLKLLIDDTRAAKTPAERWKVWWGAPGYRPEGLPPYPAPRSMSRFEQDKYDPQSPVGVQAYVAAQFLPVAAGLLAVLLKRSELSGLQLGAAALLIVWATWSWGALHERKMSALPSEIGRVVLTTVLVGLWFDSAAALAATVAWAALSALWLLAHVGWLSGREEIDSAQAP